MQNAKTVLDAFFELEEMGRCAFELKSGEHLEGYLLEVGETHALFGGGGPLAPEEPIRIELESIELGSLAYYDKRRRRWVAAPWGVAEP